MRVATSNTRIEIRDKDRSQCWSIHAEGSREWLMENIMKVLEPGEETVKILIRQKNGSMSRMIKVKKSSEVLPRLKEQLSLRKTIVDVKKNRYHLFIKYKGSREHDSKTITINAEGDFDDVFKDVERVVDSVVDKEHEKNIIFVGEKYKTTHVWIIEQNNRRKCKSVSLDGYSSEDFMELIKKNIR